MTITKLITIIGAILFKESRCTDKKEVAAMSSYIKRTFTKVHKCVNCEQELRGLAGAPEIPTHAATESRLCSTGKYPETLAKWTTTKETNNRKLHV